MMFCDQQVTRWVVCIQLLVFSCVQQLNAQRLQDQYVESVETIRHHEVGELERNLQSFEEILDENLVEIAAGGGGLLLLLIIVCVIICVRCRRKPKDEVLFEAADAGPPPKRLNCFVSHSLHQTHAQYDRMLVLMAKLGSRGIASLASTTTQEGGVEGQFVVDEQKIRRSTAFIVLFTKDYLEEMQGANSRCTQEFRIALEAGIVKIIFVCMERNLYTLAKGIKLLSNDYTLVDMKDDELLETNLNLLVAEIDSVSRQSSQFSL